MPNYKPLASEKNGRIYRGTVNAPCHNHAKREAVDVCAKCHRAYCAKCLRVRNGDILCSSCLRKEDRERTLLYILSAVLGVVSVCSLLGLFGGGVYTAAAFVLSVICAVSAVLTYRKSVEGFPPSVDTSDGYATYVNAGAVHTPTLRGGNPFPDYDLRGNPLADVTEIILQHSRPDAELFALDDVNVNDQVWMSCESSAGGAVYAENKFGYCIGWIPDIRRYTNFRQNIADTLADPLHGSVAAYLSEKYTEDNIERAHVIIARYYSV